MAQMSYYILFESVQNISTYKDRMVVQDENKKTYTQLLSRQSGYISYPLLMKLLKNEKVPHNELPEIIETFLKKNPLVSYTPPNGSQLLWNLYRGLSPWPGVWTEIELDGAKKRLKIVEMSYNEGTPEVISVQLEGKKPVSLKSFKSVYALL
jgi:methionyl-tRNA formyltransferase